MPTPHDAAVALEGIAKSLGGRVVVDGISLTVRRGEFFSLLGPSGCGKTTTLRIVAGFEEPESGRVVVAGTVVAGANVRGVPPYRRDCNTVFQDYALFPHRTVSGNVAFGLETMRLPAAEIGSRVRSALADVRLEQFGDRRPHELSGGQRQRVAMARALVRRPAVLLLDEPLGALDLKLRREMQSELKELQRRTGTAFLYVTHDQEEALAMSDRMAVMDRGRIAQEGTPRHLYDAPESAFVARFLGEANVLAGTVVEGRDGATIVGCGPLLLRTGAVPAGVSSSPGARVSVVLRPERVRLAAAPDGPLTVVESAFAGATIRSVARTADGVSVVVRSDAASSQPVAPGTRATLDVSPEDVRLVPPEPSP